MKIEILCTDQRHPVNAWLDAWQKKVSDQGLPTPRIVRDASEVGSGDVLFLISCHQIVGKMVRDRFRHTLVVHASDLPNGRGMSPHVWQIIAGRSNITMSLIEAADGIDTGPIWHQLDIAIAPHALVDQINEAVFVAEIALMDWAVANIDRAQPREQIGEPSYYRRRTRADSMVRAEDSIADIFDLLRVCDKDRYPVFFNHRGHEYTLYIEKRNQD